MARKRILAVLSSCDHEGVWQQCTRVLSRLSPDQFDVRIFLLAGNLSDQQLLQKTGLCVHLARRCRKTDPWILWPLIRYIKAYKPDLVHSWDAPANRYGPLAARICGTKTIFCSKYDAVPLKTEWGLGLAPLLARSITKVIAPHQSICGKVALSHHVMSKFVVIPPAIPTMHSQNVTRSGLLQKLQLSENCRLIATSDRLQGGNHIRNLIWAIELLKVAGDDVHLFIYGDGRKREALQRFRNRVQLEDRVHFLENHDLIAQTMEHLDFFWKVSGNMGVANRLLEVMRRAIPIIADDSLTNQEFIQHEKTGYLIPPGDPAGLASLTHHLLENPEQAKKIGATAQAAIQNKYDPKITIEKQMGLYREIL